jgi:hypothetical protein
VEACSSAFVVNKLEACVLWFHVSDSYLDCSYFAQHLLAYEIM